jgi:hypothetical protein
MDPSTLQALLREAVKETVTEVLQLLLEADRDAFLRQKGGRENGHYPRRLETAFGQVELAIPRDREGRYYPSFLRYRGDSVNQPYARRQVDVGEVAVALYAAGVTQRKAAEVMSLLLGHRYTHETKGAITDEVLEKAEAFRKRPLPEEEVLREGLGVERVALPEGQTAWIGVRGPWGDAGWGAAGAGLLAFAHGERLSLGGGFAGAMGAGPAAGLAFPHGWASGHGGSHQAIRRVYPLAEWQRCVVHQVRGSLSQVRSRDRAALAQDLRGVYMAESRREVWGGKYPALVAAWWKGALAVLAEHQPHGAVDSGDEAGDEGAGPQVSSAGGGVQAFVLGGRLDRYASLKVDPTP